MQGTQTGTDGTTSQKWLRTRLPCFTAQRRTPAHDDRDWHDEEGDLRAGTESDTDRKVLQVACHF